MARRVRKIVRIDEEKCNGCGLCVPSCEEGAIQIIDGKARLVEDRLCDGLGNCLGECPQDAITIEEREAEEFDAEGVAEYLGALESTAAGSACGGGCPGATALSLGREENAAPSAGAQPSQLCNWPVQLTLVPPHAPWLDGADLLISADCVPYALGGFHGELLAGKKVITACPKLDEVRPYLAKLVEVFQSNDIRRVTVARMEVPCCAGLVALVRQALEASGRSTHFEELVIGIEGRQLVGVGA